MKNILFIVDTPGWAYDDAAQNWRELLKSEYNIDILYLDKFEPLKINHSFFYNVKKYQNKIINNANIKSSDFFNEKLFVDKNNNGGKPLFNDKKYHGIYFFYHRALCDSRLLSTPISFHKVLVAINNEKWADKGAEEEYNTYMKGVRAIAGCNNYIINSFKNLHNNKIYRISQSINQNVFKNTKNSIISNRVGKDFIVGWSGNYNNKIKNFELIKKACESINIKLVAAKNLNREQLNAWYNKIDAVICASDSEGGPLMLLEAGAVGVPIITTKVGLAREIINDNDNGIFIDKSIDSVCNSITELSNNLELRKKIATNLQKEILLNWTYKARINEIKIALNELT